MPAKIKLFTTSFGVKRKTAVEMDLKLPEQPAVRVLQEEDIAQEVYQQPAALPAPGFNRYCLARRGGNRGKVQFARGESGLQSRRLFPRFHRAWKSRFTDTREALETRARDFGIPTATAASIVP